MSIEPIATTEQRFRDFRPYVASINDDGDVAYVGELGDGDRGVFVNDRRVDAIVDAPTSHPDIDNRGRVCVYTARHVLLVTDGKAGVLASVGDGLSAVGPLGPTMNQHGAVAFRADASADVHGVYVADSQGGALVADTNGELAGFEGLPVVDGTGAVVFRARLRDGSDAIYSWADGKLVALASTADQFHSLARFPSANESGAVAFAATTPGPEAFLLSAGALTSIAAGFASVRGALVGDGGHTVVFATPTAGTLGIYADGQRLTGVGDSMLGASVTSFALNPVSINARGQLAIRVELSNGTQAIVRAHPRTFQD